MANFIVEDIKRVLNGENHLSKLILINAGVFLLLNIILAFTENDLFVLSLVGLPAGLVEFAFHFWTLFTYMFVHEGFFHLLFNLLWLYWFGRIMADLYTQNRVLQTYLYGGLAGGILYVLFSSIPGMPVGAFLIGASGGVLAVMVATATLMPEYQMNLMFIGPVRIKYIALVGFILSTLLDFNVNTGGKIAHIGGAAYGLFYALQLRKGIEITDGVNRFFIGVFGMFKPKSKMKVVHKSYSTSNQNSYVSGMSAEERQQKTDEILDKISTSGYDSLTKAEKDFLFKVSKH